MIWDYKDSVVDGHAYTAPAKSRVRVGVARTSFKRSRV